MRYFLLLLLAGCGANQTFEESKHLFAETRAVIKNQPGWEPPPVLKVYRVKTRDGVCKYCNRKGAHYRMKMHIASIPDRGCYLVSEDRSLGVVIYLKGDLEAMQHEVDHHYHGPLDEKPAPPKKFVEFRY